jgi:hypothetical protein
MKEDFLVGDVVVCVHEKMMGSQRGLKSEEFYTVSSIRKGFIHLKGVKGGWMPFRFRKAEVDTSATYRPVKFRMLRPQLLEG